MNTPVYGSEVDRSTAMPSWVLLNVYDFAASTKILNENFFSFEFSHVSVTVHKSEFTFFDTDPDSGKVGGILKGKVHNNKFSYRHSIYLGQTTKTPREFSQILDQLYPEYQGSNYTLFTKNCMTFARDLVGYVCPGTTLPPKFLRAIDNIGMSDSMASAVWPTLKNVIRSVTGTLMSSVASTSNNNSSTYSSDSSSFHSSYVNMPSKAISPQQLPDLTSSTDCDGNQSSSESFSPRASSIWSDVHDASPSSNNAYRYFSGSSIKVGGMSEETDYTVKRTWLLQ